MSASHWRFAAATAIGTSHTELELPCQDAQRCTLMRDSLGASVLVAAAADGAGTAPNSETGANLACSVFFDRIAAFLSRHSISDLDSNRIASIVEQVRAALVDCARNEVTALRAYACTFLAVVIGDEHACFCQIGDGAIVVADGGDAQDWCWVFWPQRGEFANATAFLTDDDALDAIQIEVGPRSIKEVAILTDGIEKLVLQYDTQSVFAPFFETMFPPIRASTASGEDASLSGALAAYLASAPVNQRTDDDKTLILASRRRVGGR